jgi:hypothetical protein
LALGLIVRFNHTADSIALVIIDRAIYSNNNRGIETQQSTNDFDANGNLLTLDNIGK